MKKNNHKRGLLLLTAGLFVFVARYVPLYNYNVGFVDKWFSLHSLSGLCGTIAGNFLDRCNWIVPLNIIVIILSIILVGYGILLIYMDKTK
ncbi:MAG: hypothetical protein ACOC16_01630 [Nanoarchaeota archaeon]